MKRLLHVIFLSALLSANTNTFAATNVEYGLIAGLIAVTIATAVTPAINGNLTTTAHGLNVASTTKVAAPVVQTTPAPTGCSVLNHSLGKC